MDLSKYLEWLILKPWYLCGLVLIAAALSYPGIFARLSYTDATQMTDCATEAVKLLFEATKVMIPVITGFLVFFAGTLGGVRSQLSVPTEWERSRSLLIETIVLGLLALALWTGAMPSCIIALESRQIGWLHFGQWCARTGHVAFFLSVLCALLLYYRVFFHRG